MLFTIKFLKAYYLKQSSRLVIEWEIAKMEILEPSSLLTRGREWKQILILFWQILQGRFTPIPQSPSQGMGMGRRALVGASQLCSLLALSIPALLPLSGREEQGEGAGHGSKQLPKPWSENSMVQIFLATANIGACDLYKQI